MDLKVKTTVLIVDDEESIREILKYNLEREKFEVFEAADGEEAIRMCTEHRPNLILLDIMLPKKDGVAVCKEIRYKLNMKEMVQYYIRKPFEKEYAYYLIKNFLELLQVNRRISPLTGLPGNVQIQAEIKKRIFKREKFRNAIFRFR